MKLNIQGYEIEIKAKYRNAARFNKEDTNAIVAIIGIMAGEAKERYSALGLRGLENQSNEWKHEIYKTLEKAGYFNE